MNERDACTYDSMNRVIAVANTIGARESYAYNAQGLLAESRNAVWYGLEGNYAMATVSAICALPFVGSLVGGSAGLALKVIGHSLTFGMAAQGTWEATERAVEAYQNGTLSGWNFLDVGLNALGMVLSGKAAFSEGRKLANRIAASETGQKVAKGFAKGKDATYSVGDAIFMDADDAFLKNISRRKDVDPNGYFDVVAHGTPKGIQITYNGQHITVDHRIAAKLIQNSEGYNGQNIRLLSCNVGALDDGFAQNLANQLNVKVYAPTNYLWSNPRGNYFVAGMTDSGLPDMNNIEDFKLFKPGGNK